MKTKVGMSKQYGEFFSEIKTRIKAAQYDALKAVNKELINLYWDIGRMIIKRQKQYGWGKSIVESLAKDLQKEFPGIQGFSSRNIWYMRDFYEYYSIRPKLQPMVAEISWTKHLIIMQRCDSDLEKEFYIQMTKNFGWTKDVLIHQIENDTYGKTVNNQTNFTRTLPYKIAGQAKITVKDEYTFDFLELSPEHSERQLERGLMARMDKFLREVGGAIAFVGSQYRLEVSGKEYFIDILLYHRHLRCLVAVELKVGEFLPEYVGKMQFYLAVLDDKVKASHERSSIGIIVCKAKDKTIVEYALKESKKPIGVATYKITKKLSGDLQKELPTPERIAQLMG